jgi:hypothetical protein
MILLLLGQYDVKHSQNSRIEGVPSAHIMSRVKRLSAAKTTVEDSGKLIYNLYKNEWSPQPGPRLLNQLTFGSELQFKFGTCWLSYYFL